MVKKQAKADGKKKSTPISVTRVDPQVMALAKERARPGTRIRVVDSKTVIVENVPTAG